MSQRRILLADADAFFVAIARMVDPDGAGKAPLLIVGGTRASRGVVCSASYETRRFGVRSAMSIAQALRLCPKATIAPVSGEMVRRKHQEVRAVLERFSPVRSRRDRCSRPRQRNDLIIVRPEPLRFAVLAAHRARSFRRCTAMRVPVTSLEYN